MQGNITEDDVHIDLEKPVEKYEERERKKKRIKMKKKQFCEKRSLK